jgi:hypothetical protein
VPAYRFCAARTAAHRRLVASMIAFRPAALILRFLRTGADVPSDPAPPARFAAHLFRCAAAILPRAAADIRRRFLVGRDDSAPSAGPATQHLPQFGNLRIYSFLLLLEAVDGSCDKFVIESYGHRVNDHFTLGPAQ